MSLGPVMLDLLGVEITQQESEILQHPLVGGVILFTRNFESVEQLQALIQALHQLRTPRLLIAVDHEGGRVQRFREGFTTLPASANFGELYTRDPHRGRRMVELAGWLMAAELRAFGVDFSFAPVLDVDHGISEVIGDRAFHRDPGVVAELARYYIKGMFEAGMAATGKHFPGHGAVEADSHVATPVDEREYNEIYAQDILPFKRLVHHGLAAVMPAHVIYPKVDARPAGFSQFWLKDVLRRRLAFEGVIFSDDLNMKGASTISENYVERADAALEAGCDMVLICNNPSGAMEVLDGLGDLNDPVAHLRLARMHGRHDMSRQQLHQLGKWKDASALLTRYQDDPDMQLEL